MGRLFAGFLAGACSLFVFAAPAAAVPAVAVTPGNSLLLFDTSTPGTVSPRNIAGLGASETVRGIDVRPTTGEVFASTATGLANSFITTYRLDANTGVATLVGATGVPLGAAGDIVTGYDFNPTVDRIRYVTGSTADENARLNPNNGAVADDNNLNPAATTDVIAEAYDRNRPGATLTTLFAIDRNNSQLARQGDVDGAPQSPNTGIVTDIGPLGVALDGAVDGGFDISVTGTAYAALTSGGVTRIYTINLATGAATAVGLIGNGLTQVFSLAILDTDLDTDGVAASADNCDSTANADQANLDGDAEGDLCDADQDGDGISDAVEAQLGTNPRSADSDGDGRPDGSDSCPTLAAATASACPDAAPAPAPAPALTFTIGGFPRTIALRALRSRGVALTLEPNQGASFLVELRGRLRGSRLARAGDFVLAERSLSLAAGRRSIRVRIPRSQRTRLRRRALLTLRVTATDASGRTTVQGRRLRIR